MPATRATNQFITINIPTKKKKGPDWLQRKLQVTQDSKFPFQFSTLYSKQAEHDKYKTNAAPFPFSDTSEPNPRSQNEKNNFRLRSNQKQTNHYHPLHNKKSKKKKKKFQNDAISATRKKTRSDIGGLGFWEMLTGTGWLMSEIQSPQKQRKSLTLM